MHAHLRGFYPSNPLTFYSVYRVHRSILLSKTTCQSELFKGGNTCRYQFVVVVVFAIFEVWESVGAPLIAHSSQTKNDRNLWFIMPSRTENVVYELLAIFKNWLMDTREKPSQRKQQSWQSLQPYSRYGCTFDHPQLSKKKW